MHNTTFPGARVEPLFPLCSQSRAACQRVLREMSGTLRLFLPPEVPVQSANERARVCACVRVRVRASLFHVKEGRSAVCCGTAVRLVLVHTFMVLSFFTFHCCLYVYNFSASVVLLTALVLLHILTEVINKDNSAIKCGSEAL